MSTASSNPSVSYHGALAPLQEAAEHTQFACVADLMSGGGGCFRPVLIATRHIRLLFRGKQFRDARGILVRDFSNIPLAVVYPFLGAWKQQTWWLVNHNLQWTETSKVERTAFRLLGRLGTRFLFFEEIPKDKLRELGLSSEPFAAIPHPVPRSPLQRHRSGGIKTVGIIGEFRPEKKVDELLAALEPLRQRFEVIVALPNRAEFQKQSSFAQADWFKLIDTSGAKAYEEAMVACDVILLNHPPAAYQFRASGLIADAAAARVPVLARETPLLRQQIEHPVPIGRCFQNLRELPEQLEKISTELENDSYDFEAYQKARSTEALTEILTRKALTVSTRNLFRDEGKISTEHNNYRVY